MVEKANVGIESKNGPFPVIIVQILRYSERTFEPTDRFTLAAMIAYTARLYQELVRALGCSPCFACLYPAVITILGEPTLWCIAYYASVQPSIRSRQAR